MSAGVDTTGSGGSAHENRNHRVGPDSEAARDRGIGTSMRVIPTLLACRRHAQDRIRLPEPRPVPGGARDPFAASRGGASAAPEPAAPRSPRALSPPRGPAHARSLLKRTGTRTSAEATGWAGHVASAAISGAEVGIGDVVGIS